MNEIENSENILQTSSQQYAKKVVSNSLWLVDVAIGLVNSVLNFPEEQMKVFGEIKYYYYRVLPFGQVKMMIGLIHASYSWPQRQAVNKTDFLCCIMYKYNGHFYMLNSKLLDSNNFFHPVGFRMHWI